MHDALSKLISHVNHQQLSFVDDIKFETMGVDVQWRSQSLALGGGPPPAPALGSGVLPA